MANVRSKFLFMAFVCASLLPMAGSAQSNSGWAALGEMLSGQTKRDAQERARQEVMYETWMRAEIEAAQLSARNMRAEEDMRNKLRYWWTRAGYSQAESTEMANAFEYTSSQPAVIAQVRRKGIDAAIADVRTAAENYNFLLANQLLVGIYVVLGDRSSAAPGVDQEAVKHANEAVLKANQPQ